MTTARGKKPRNGNTAAMVAFIRASKAGARTDELADHVGILPRQVAPLLHDYVQRGELVTCIVQRPGQRDCTLYRDGSGKAARTEAKGWKGQSFSPAASRKIAGKSLTAADIPGAAPPAPPIVPQEAIAPTESGAEEFHFEIIDAAPSAADSAHDQPAVSRNTGSAAGATPLSAGPRRKTPAARAQASTAGGLRLAIGDDARLALTIDDDTLILDARQTARLGEFLHGSQGIWGHVR